MVASTLISVYRLAMSKTLNSAIDATRKHLDELKKAAAELPGVESDLAALIRTRQILNGDSTATATQSETQTGSLSIADASERILGEVRDLHADEITKRVQEKFGIETSKAVVVGTILRYAKDGRRFKRTQPNTFALLGEQSDKE